MRIFLLILVVAGAGVWFFTRGDNSPPSDTAVPAAFHTDPNVAVGNVLPSCIIGVPVDGTVAVSQTVAVRTEPSEDAEKIVNQRASEAFGQTEYHNIDNSTTVRRLCDNGEWTLMSVESPAWLDFVKGWVPSSVLRPIMHTAAGKRVFVEDDFLWDESSNPYRAEIIEMTNRISTDNSKCGALDPSSMALSPSKSKPNDPVFFVTCGEGAGAFNVWFRPSDANGDAKFAAIPPIEETTALQACRDAAIAASLNPLTVGFAILTATYGAHPSGRADVVSTFTAKNGLGVDLSFKIRCLFDGADLIETSIWQSSI